MSYRLTPKQHLFVQFYLESFNATEAAKRAGYKGSRITLASVGYENLHKPLIKKIINDSLATGAMSSNEILERLTKHARGTLDDFLSINSEGLLNFDLEKAKELGVMEQVERLSIHNYIAPDGTKYQHIDIKLYSSQKALTLLGKGYGLFKGSPVEKKEPNLDLPKVKKQINIEDYVDTFKAMDRFVAETYGSKPAANAYWMAVVFGFIPEPNEDGVLAGLKPSRTLDEYGGVEEHI